MYSMRKLKRRWEERTVKVKGGRGGATRTLRILDACPAIVAMPNPLLDPRAARASERFWDAVIVHNLGQRNI